MKRYSCGRLGMYEDPEGRYVEYRDPEPARAYAGERIEKTAPSFYIKPGFITSTGRFVAQDEAEFIARAAGQEWPL